MYKENIIVAKLRESDTWLVFKSYHYSFNIHSVLHYNKYKKNSFFLYIFTFNQGNLGFHLLLLQMKCLSSSIFSTTHPYSTSFSSNLFFGVRLHVTWKKINLLYSLLFIIYMLSCFHGCLYIGRKVNHWNFNIWIFFYWNARTWR